jgi:hypothetical protein
LLLARFSKPKIEEEARLERELDAAETAAGQDPDLPANPVPAE